MRVLVTGGSGFLGCHTIAALTQVGHEVVALVRDEAKLQRALQAVGAPRVAVVHGDVSDDDAVRRGLAGASAAIHGAAVYALDPRRAAEMHRTNVDGTRRVLTAAVEAGCDPVVHVSSITALFPLPKTAGVADPPLGTARFPYSGSKRESEKIARALQASGAPVVCTHPGNIFGPHDPGPGEMRNLLRSFLGNRFPFVLSGAGITVVDVRWLARAHAALVVPDQGPRLVPMGGRYFPWSEFFRLLRGVTGRTLPQFLPSPRWLSVALGWLADRLRNATGLSLPFTEEQNSAAYLSGHTDNTLARSLAGPEPDPADTMRDAITWLAEAGYLPRRWAGSALSSARS